MAGFWNDEIIKEAEENQGGFDPIPAATYTLVLVDAELKETKNKTGHYINCQFEVIAPAFAGRKIFAKYNINNTSPKATSIGLGQLKTLCAACNKIDWYEQLKTCPNLDKVAVHVETLHATLAASPFSAKVVVVNNDIYGAGNEIKNYASVSGSESPAIKADTKNKKSSPFD